MNKFGQPQAVRYNPVPLYFFTKNIFFKKKTSYLKISLKNRFSSYRNSSTVKPVYNGHPWDPKKVAAVQTWPVCTGFSIKISIKSSLAGLRLAVVDRWPLFRGAR